MPKGIKKGAVMSIMYSFPPVSGSGSIRNYQMYRFIPDFDWKIFVLTIKGRKDDSSTIDFHDDSEMTVIERTRCFYPHEFLIYLKSKLSRGNTGKTALKPKKENQESKDAKTASKVKDFVTDFISTPDKYIGWLPFALVRGYKVLSNNHIDVIYSVGKPWTSFFVGFFLKALFKKPLLIDFMDPWMTSSWRRSKGTFLDGINRFLEKFIVRKADYVIANTDELSLDFINRLKVDKEKVSVITCGYNDDVFKEHSRVEGPTKNNEKFVITHIGSFYNKRNPLNFLKAVNEAIEQGHIPKNRVKLQFIGNFDDIAKKESDLKRILAAPAIREILDSKSWVPHSEAIACILNSDLLLLLQPGAEFQIPAKLYEYACARKPILSICTKGGAVYNLVSREKWGEVVDNEDIGGIMSKVVKFYEEFEKNELGKFQEYGNVSNYSYKALAERLSNIFDNIKFANSRGNVNHKRLE